MANDLVLPRAHHPIAEFVVANMERMLPLLRQGVVDRQQFAAAVVVAANELKPGSCEPGSVLVAAAHCAMIGLVPGKSLKLAYFVPRSGKCSLDVSYQGFINLATRNNYLRWVHPDIVLAGEEFFVGVKGGRPTLEHDIPPDRRLTEKEVRDRMIGAYCLYETAAGGVSHVYMSRSEIDDIAKRGGPLWGGQFYASMVRKTPIRRAANYWRLTPELGMALRLEDQAEIGEPQDLGLDLALPQPGGFSLRDLSEGEDEQASG